MNVEQAGDDELAAGVDGLGGITRDAGVDGRDPASRDRDVAHRIEPR